MNLLYRYFPKQIGIPYRIVAKDKIEFYNLINTNNGKRRIFASLYNYGDANSTLLLDKIWFDMDSKNSFDVIKKFHDWAKKNDYMHLMVFSGGGFHIYLMCENYKGLQNPKVALKDAQYAIINELGLSVGRAEIADIDEHIIGDVARIVTVLNTYNVKRRKYCISISESDLEKGLDYIKELANTQQFKLYWYGNKRFDISNFNHNSPQGTIEELDIVLQERINNDLNLTTFPPCIASKFLSDYVSFRDRFHIYCWLRDAGYSLTQVKSLVRKYWSNIDGGQGNANLAEYIFKNRQIESVFNRDGMLCANCEKLKLENFCVKKICKWKNRLYL